MSRMERRRLEQERKKEKAMITIAVTNVITAVLNFLKAMLG
ncbi:hypothetical protein [Lysinibacillus irui]|nr:hypothetical protein [Lysinibacillus irui]MEA0563258.1 hypothetical protein [Lysinibacillus irui]